MTIGGRIARLRKRQKLTQKELAEQTGVSRSLIGQIEANNVKPTLAFLKQFIRICHTSYEAVIEGTGMETELPQLKEPEAIYFTPQRELEMLKEMLGAKQQTIDALRGENESLKKVIEVLEKEIQQLKSRLK
ncbi:MAG: XRE family transcriptional regulator [Bacteroidetes bacterium]|nr:MAG: XRE family transcriptional regulator [Bacteroidota bacterium]